MNLLEPKIMNTIFNVYGKFNKFFFAGNGF